MNSPYSGLPKRAYWRSGVAERAPLDPGDLYQPKFKITPKTNVVTAGSCFAQHVGRALRDAGCRVLDAEPAPAAMPEATAQKFGYGLFSARYANVYTMRQLVQILDEAEGKFRPADPVWQRDGRFFDAMRPSVEPMGLDSAELVRVHRAHHLAKVLEVFAQADLFVFTFGLTEAWVHGETGTVYPTAPGTIAGDYDPAAHVFKNYSYPEIYRDFVQFRKRMMQFNRRMKFLVTVSPVPLTATASGRHVEVATNYSKAVLRAVAGQLSDQFDNVDYFPSYEIITSPNNHGVYYESNKRSVSPLGVSAAMSLFLSAQEMAAGTSKAERRKKASVQKLAAPSIDEVVCEEALLDAFAR